MTAGQSKEEAVEGEGEGLEVGWGGQYVFPGTAATGTLFAVAMGTKLPPLLEFTEWEPDFVVEQEEEKEEKEEGEEEEMVGA